jgi:exonuclease SbcC
MLEKLILENWKSHYKTEIDFESGYNVFTGNIGSGKSSIIEGLVFALFGTTMSVNSRKIQIKDLIMAKPTQMESSKITLYFKIDDNNYSVERILYNTKSSQAKLYKNDKLISGPKPNDVNAEIEKILGLNIDTFMRANYSEQNQIDFFLKMQSAQRKQMFDNIFDIDFYDTLSVNSRQLSNKLIDKISDEEKYLIEIRGMIKNYNIIEIKSEIDRIQNLILNLNLELTTSKTKLDSLIQIENKLKQSKIDSEETLKNINYYSGQKEQIKTELEEYNLDNLLYEKQNILNKINELALLIENSKELKKTVDKNNLELIKTREKLQNNLSTISKNTTLLNENIVEDVTLKIDNNIKELELQKQKLSELNEKKIILKTKIESIKKEMQELESSKKQILNIGAKCPVCEQKLDESHINKITSEKENKIKELTINIEENIITLNSLNDQELNYKKNVDELDLILTKLRDIHAKSNFMSKIKDETKQIMIENEALNKNIIELTEFISKQSDLDKNITNYQKDYDLKCKERDLIKKAESYSELNKRLDDLKLKLTKINYNKDEHELIAKDIAELETSHKYKLTIIEQNKTLLKDQQFKSEQYYKLENNLKQKELEIKQINDITSDLSIFSNVAKKTQEEIRERMIQQINDIFMELWPKIYPYTDFEQIKLNIVDGDYKIELYFDKNYKRTLDDFVSGGERSAIALTLRLAISLVMKNKLNLIILDEPTHNLDENSVQALSELFNNHLLRFVNQIFVITHDKQLEHYAKNIYSIKRDKDNDLPSSVEHIGF